jgi:hypothetical protein
MEAAIPLPIASSIGVRLAWLPSDNSLWLPCVVTASPSAVTVTNGRPDARLDPPAGAPVVADDGAVIAIGLAIGPEEADDLDEILLPRISGTLPGWILSECGLVATNRRGI